MLTNKANDTKDEMQIQLTAKEKREKALRSVWYTVEETGNDPTQTDDLTADFILQEQYPSFIKEVSDNQWKLFLREFHKKQKDEMAYRAYQAKRAARMAK